jgi:hypothetical protein
MSEALTFQHINELFPLDIALIIGWFVFRRYKLNRSFVYHDCIPCGHKCTPDEQLIGACMKGNLKLMRDAIRNGASEFEDAIFFARKWDSFLLMTKFVRNDEVIIRAAIQHDMIDTVNEYAISNRRFSKKSYVTACKNGGDCEILAKFSQPWPNHGLYAACRVGDYELACKMIWLGATWFDVGLYGACKGGNIKVAKLMILSGATDFKSGYLVARDRCNDDAANLMIGHGATIYDDPIRFAKDQDNAKMKMRNILCYADM